MISLVFQQLHHIFFAAFTILVVLSFYCLFLVRRCKDILLANRCTAPARQGAYAARQCLLHITAVVALPSKQIDAVVTALFMGN